MAVIYTKHAKEMLLVRGIGKELTDQCADNPDHILSGDYGRKIYLKDFGINYLKLVVSEKDSEESTDKVIITVHWIAKRRIKL